MLYVCQCHTDDIHDLEVLLNFGKQMMINSLKRTATREGTISVDCWYVDWMEHFSLPSRFGVLCVFRWWEWVLGTFRLWSQMGFWSWISEALVWCFSTGYNENNQGIMRFSLLICTQSKFIGFFIFLGECLKINSWESFNLAYYHRDYQLIVAVIIRSNAIDIRVTAMYC